MAEREIPSWKTEEDEEDEELEQVDYRSQKDAVLFVIDISDSMLCPPQPSAPDTTPEDSPAFAALRCALALMQQRIISNPKDMMGVLLIGTKKTKITDNVGEETSAYPNCYLLCDLGVPFVQDVKTLRSLISGDASGDGGDELLSPTNEKVSMANILACANFLFMTRAPDFGSRRLFIITDEDDPASKAGEPKNLAAVRAKDLYDLGVVIELFPISKPGNKFDRAVFYDDIIYRDSIEGDELSVLTDHKSSAEGYDLMNHLLADINSKQVAKRALFSDFPVHLGQGLTISVKGYNIFQRQKPVRSEYIYTDGEKPQIVVGTTTLARDDTTTDFEPANIKKAYKFGGELVHFTPEEAKELRNFGPPGLTIIGFKPQSMLPHWASMNKSTFIYPTDNGFVGSTRVYTALWEKLLKDKKMGLGWFIARSNANPVIVAIIPSAEKVDAATNLQTFPAGLWLSPLPWADDVRNPPASTVHVEAPDNLVDKMHTIMGQLQLPNGIYDPKRYPNPSLQWHYQVLQAIALDEELPTKAVDKTIPSYKQINKRAGEYAIEWKDLLDKEYAAYEREQSKLLKRNADDDDASTTKKKVKTESKEGKAMTAADLKKMADEGTLETLKVADLREICKSKSLNAVGVKAILVGRLEDWCAEV